MADGAAEPVLLEVGPVTIGIAGRHSGATSDATAALEALDDPVALIGDHAVGVDALLATVIAEALGPAPAAVTVVHPSWWTARRVRRVRAAASAAVASVTVLSRSEMVRRGHCGGPVVGDPVVIEIAGDLIAVCGRGRVRLFARCDTAGITSLAAHLAGETTVVIDTPNSVPGAVHTAGEIRKALAHRGIAVSYTHLTLPTTPYV